MKITTVLMAALVLSAGVVCAQTTIIINGKTIRAADNSVIANDNTVMINGKVVSGNVTEGSGQDATEIRELDGFNEVHLYLSANVRVTPGETPRCRITTDDNIIPLISTKISDGALRISTDHSYVTNRKVTIDVETPRLTKAEVNGSGNIDLREVAEDRLALAISGSGDIAAKGRVEDLTVAINGSGNVDATDLEAATATVAVNGSGDADVNVAKFLTAKILGSGNIRYIGTPDMRTSVLGSGELVRK